MKKQPLFVAFSNQKGGVGKSAITILMASYFHYSKDKNVLVVDCDFPQHSLSGMRERDKTTVSKSTNYKRMLMAQFEQIDKKAYTIINANPAEAHSVAKSFIMTTSMEYDIVFFDLPGTVNTPGLFTTLFNMDYVFMPIITDRMIIQSSLSFATTVQDYINSDNNTHLKGLYLFWNRIDKRVSSEVFDISNKIITHLNLKLLETVLPESYRYSRELSPVNKPFFRSTLFPPASSMLKGSNLDLFADEIEQIMKL